MKRLLSLIFLFAVACTPEKESNDSGAGDGGYKPAGEITVRGIVYGEGSKTIPGVVVSDGLLCVRTGSDGYFEMDSDLSCTKFIMVSIPSGYSAPTDANGLPIFYHRVTDQERENGQVQVTFEFYPVTNDPDRYTLIVGADPQPRALGIKNDSNAYHALEMCEDFYRDMREKRATIMDRNVYGLMLGDIVHENMSLFDNYIAGLKTLKFPMFNVMGNHDNDPAAKDDSEGSRYFEEKLGPTYYSFNIGRQHYVVLDNIIMKLRSDGSLRDYDQGLTDRMWQWLQNDLSYVDRSVTIMVAAHSPMFKSITMSERSLSAEWHRSDYAALLSKYAKVHAWAGHHHTTFNYVYPEASHLKNLEVHTVARSTGELWTNEYVADGTPRGYTVVEVDGDDISWYFKPTKYQTGKFYSKSSTPFQPEYKYRDWSYDGDGVAIMKDGTELSESYQMKVYRPGEYHDNFNALISGGQQNKYVYANVFLWDEKWDTPKYNGQPMTRVGYKEAYCLADFEIKNHYSKYGYTLSNTSYGPGDNDLHTLFKVYEPKSTGEGTVSVTDRFGNEYSSTISW